MNPGQPGAKVGWTTISRQLVVSSVHSLTPALTPLKCLSTGWTRSWPLWSDAGWSQPSATPLPIRPFSPACGCRMGSRLGTGRCELLEEAKVQRPLGRLPCPTGVSGGCACWVQQPRPAFRPFCRGCAGEGMARVRKSPEGHPLPVAQLAALTPCQVGARLGLPGCLAQTGQQQTRPIVSTEGCARPHRHPGSMSGPRRKQMAYSDEDNLGTVKRLVAGGRGSHKGCYRTPGPPTPGQTEQMGEHLPFQKENDMGSPPGEE